MANTVVRYTVRSKALEREMAEALARSARPNNVSLLEKILEIAKAKAPAKPQVKGTGGVGMDSFYELARWDFVRDARKHDLHPDPEQYATDEVNKLTNDELLERISYALDELLDRRKAAS